MLAPADAALVQRDPGLPGLELLLDDDALSRWLSDSLGTPVLVRGRYLRYKPAVSCVLAAELDDGSARRSCLFWAYARPTSVKLTKTRDQAALGTILATQPALGVLATEPAADRALPALALLDGAETRSRLLHRIFRDRVDGAHVRLRALRHKPGRRWVGLLQPTAGPPVVLRLYPPHRAGAAARAIRAWEETGPCTPHLVGRHLGRGALAVEYLEGTVLAHRSGVQESRHYGLAGAALGRLHGCRDVVLAPSGASAQVHAARLAGRNLVSLLPDLRDEVERLTQTLHRGFAGCVEIRTPVHGDFSPEQVVLGEDGEVGLIDLDAAALADPAVDLACATSAILCEAALGAVTSTHAEQRRAALYAGYASVRPLPDPERLAVHEAAHLLRRAVEPFRLRGGEAWPAATRELVTRADHALRASTVAGGAR